MSPKSNMFDMLLNYAKIRFLRESVYISCQILIKRNDLEGFGGNSDVFLKKY